MAGSRAPRHRMPVSQGQSSGQQLETKYWSASAMACAGEGKRIPTVVVRLIPRYSGSLYGRWIMAGKIFINYRRDDSPGTAGRLQERLVRTFGRENLFMDVDDVPKGVDFVDYLDRQVAACDVFL